jgi:hypothetical protein
MGGQTSARCLRYASSVASTFLRSSRASCGAQHATRIRATEDAPQRTALDGMDRADDAPTVASHPAPPRRAPPCF